MRTSSVKYRGPAQVRVIDRDVILLRKVDFRVLGAGMVERIANTALRPKEYEGDQPWFHDGYVAGEQPRDAMLSEAIMRATTGFAIARTDSGEILAEFGKDEVVRASEITSSAKVQLAIDVTIGDEASQSDYNRSGDRPKAEDTSNGRSLDANSAPSETRKGTATVEGEAV